MTFTLGLGPDTFKHLFERFWSVSVAGGRTSIRRSIEQPFDLEATMATTPARTPAVSRPETPGGVPSTHGVPRRATHLRLVATSEPPGSAPVTTPSGARSAARPEPPLRLTRRGRLVLRSLVVLVLLALMAGVALTMARGADAADGPARTVAVAHHVVLPGETLWGIATSLAPHADPRDTIARILEFNTLSSSAVHAGQIVAIPPNLPGR
jgi:LysM domain-containing protein